MSAAAVAGASTSAAAAGASASAMEGSSATCLPEADSLPDGLAENSSADTASPASPTLVADDPSGAALDSDRPADTSPGGGEALGDPSVPAPAVEDTSSVAAEALEALSRGLLRSRNAL